ncbi:MAG: FlgO family outer membrane protein [Bdellovibrionota bacterium]
MEKFQKNKLNTQSNGYRRYYKFFLLFLIAIILTSCSRRYSDLPPYSFVDSEQSVGRFKTSYLAEKIDEYYKGVNPGPIGIASFVNIDDLHNTSTFGRMLAEQLMSELVMKGYEVVELRHSQAIQFLADDGGEFALSRNVNNLRRERDLGGIVVGTYTVSPKRVYLNARLINPTTSLVLSAATAEMTKTAEIEKMLKGGNSGNLSSSTLERVPITDVNETNYFKKKLFK